MGWCSPPDPSIRSTPRSCGRRPGRCSVCRCSTPTSTSVRGSGLRTIGTSSHRGTAHTDADLTGRIALVVGNEARGLPDDARVDEWVTIRHHGRAESLNVAMAATVLCFEAARQRELG